MNGSHFDLIVVGTGPSGGTVARKIAEQGCRVAIVESREFGGTCALRGCNPKKVYTNAGSLVDQARRATGKLIKDARVDIDWSQLQTFKASFTEPIVRKSESSYQEDGIATFHGSAKFRGPSHLIVGESEITADRIVVATGATPAPLKFEGIEHVTHSDEFFELKAIPDRVLFIGGGYVSMEFAHVVARCNVKATIVERNASVLAGFDPDLVGILTRYSDRQGIDFRMKCEVASIVRQPNGSLQVDLDNGEVVHAGLVVHGAGRIPNIRGLNLESARIDHCETGIAVDKFMRSTTNSIVFAAGDCAASGMPRLTPVANEEARIIAKNLFLREPEAIPDYGSVPKVAFTTPSIASVGLSEKDSHQMKSTIDVRFENTSSWGNVRKTGSIVSGYKVLIDKDTDKVVGAHLLGPAAEETINLFALAMKHGLSATDMKSTLFAFPTFASDVRRML